MSDTVTMFHGTCAALHDSIMREGLRPAAHGGPYITTEHDEAVGYAIWATQCYRVETGEPDPEGIVYRLRIPSDRIFPATVEGSHKVGPDFVVPGGVPVEWFVDAQKAGLPLDREVTDSFAVAARNVWRGRDLLAAARRLGPLEEAGALAEAMSMLGAGL